MSYTVHDSNFVSSCKFALHKINHVKYCTLLVALLHAIKLNVYVPWWSKSTLWGFPLKRFIDSLYQCTCSPFHSFWRQYFKNCFICSSWSYSRTSICFAMTVVHIVYSSQMTLQLRSAVIVADLFLSLASSKN